MRDREKNRLNIGKRGEEISVDFLEKKGYSIIATNVRVQGSEIDIIATREGILCFIEVKTRSYGVGSAERAVGYKKLQHIKKAALGYCLLKGIIIDATPICFEQVSVYMQLGASDIRPIIKHYVIPIDNPY